MRSAATTIGGLPLDRADTRPAPPSGWKTHVRLENTTISRWALTLQPRHLAVFHHKAYLRHDAQLSIVVWAYRSLGQYLNHMRRFILVVRASSEGEVNRTEAVLKEHCQTLTRSLE